MLMRHKGILIGPHAKQVLSNERLCEHVLVAGQRGQQLASLSGSIFVDEVTRFAFRFW